MENNKDYAKMPQACKDAGYCFYTACTCKITEPTPTIDELNLDERAKAYADGLEKENTAINTILYSSYKQGWKDNHASFVALVEGEIAGFRREINSGVLSNAGRERNMLRIGVLSTLLNKIK